MQQAVRVLFAALLAATLAHVCGAASAQQPQAAPPAVKQIKLTEKQVLDFIAAQKDMTAVLEKIQGATPDPLPPQLQAELDAAARKHGFKDFQEYDEVVANITMVMSGMDPKTKEFVEPQVVIRKEIAEVTADQSIPAQQKKQILEELNEALKAAQPIQFPSNIDLVKKHYDKIDAALS